MDLSELMLFSIISSYLCIVIIGALISNLTMYTKMIQNKFKLQNFGGLDQFPVGLLFLSVVVQQIIVGTLCLDAFEQYLVYVIVMIVALFSMDIWWIVSKLSMWVKAK